MDKTLLQTMIEKDKQGGADAVMEWMKTLTPEESERLTAELHSLIENMVSAFEGVKVAIQNLMTTLIPSLLIIGRIFNQAKIFPFDDDSKNLSQ